MSLADRTVKTGQRLMPRRVEGVIEPNPALSQAPLSRHIEHIAQQVGDKLAIRSASRAYTYPDLNRLANQLAHAVLEQMGPGPAGVGLLIADTAQLIVAMLACMKAGKCFTPIDVQYPIGRIAFILSDSEAGLVIIDDRSQVIATQTLIGQRQVLNIDHLEQALPENNLASEAELDWAFSMLYTSGSTGNPKGIKKSNRHRVHSFTLSQPTRALAPQDRDLLVGSPGFGSVQSKIVRGLMSGASLHPYDIKQDGMAGLARWIQSEKISLFSSTPTLFRHLGEHLDDEARFPSVRLVALGGEATLKSDADLFLKHFNHPDVLLRVSYASSETGTISVQYVNAETDIPGNVIPVGYPVPKQEVFIWDEADREVAPGEIGEIIVRGPGLIKGYWNRAGQSQGRFWEDPTEPGKSYYRTGDLGRFLADGRLQHVGRKDGMVKIRGYRIEILEIEGALTGLQTIKEAAVVAVDDDRGDKKLVAYIVTENSTTITRRQLRQDLAKTLPEFMLPDTFVKLDHMPLNANGKTDRGSLPAPESGRPEWGPAYTAPQSRMETALTKVWQDLLAVSPIGVDDNFFDLGGHSLLAARMTDRVEARLGVRIGMAHLFSAQTVREMAGLIERGDVGAGWSPVVTLQPDGELIPFFCVHGMTGDVLWFAELAGRMGPDRPVYGIQSLGLDGVQDPIDNLEAMASLYILEMRAIQPNGPYFIGGASLGGVIVMEMAQQLRATGLDVGAVVIFDTTPPDQRLDPRFALSAPRKFGRFSRNFPRWLQGMARKNPTEVGQRLGRKVKAGLQRLGLGRKTPRSAADRLDYTGELADYRIRVIEANSRANRSYTLKPYSGRTLLFRASQRPLMSFQDPADGWQALVGDPLDVKDIFGSHEGIFQHPGVDKMADFLETYLAESPEKSAA